MAILGGGLVLVAYTLTLFVARDLSVGDALVAGAANAVPTLVFGIVAWRLIVNHVVGRAPAIQVAAHVGIGAGFSLLSYWLLMVLLGAATGMSATEFDVRPFPSRATAWQLLENVTIYGLLAVHAYWYSQRQAPGLVIGGEADAGEAPRTLSRFFIRSGDDILPIDVAAIVSIAGADDYAEVSTHAGRRLVRMTLAQFEAALDPARFIRVHRSRIVNVEMIARAEPAGDGRILLHMSDGEMVQTSRTGARRLRDHVI